MPASKLAGEVDGSLWLCPPASRPSASLWSLRDGPGGPALTPAQLGWGRPGAAADQISAGRPVVVSRRRWALPVRPRAMRAVSMRLPGRLRLKRSRSWVRVRPSGLAVSAVWICSATGSAVAARVAQATERAA